MDIRFFIITPFFLASAAAFWVAGKAWSLKRTPGAISLAMCFYCSSWWSLCEGLLYFGFDKEINIRITQFQYLGLVWVAPWGLIFVLNLFTQGSLARPGRSIFLFILPVMTIILAWTNPWHHLLWEKLQVVEHYGIPMLALDHGPAFWAFSIYNHIILIAAIFFLLKKMAQEASLFRAQAILVILSIALASIANLIYVAGYSPIPNIDPTPLAFFIVSCALGWGVIRRRLLDIAPAAKVETFNSLVDGILVLDKLGRVTDLNPASEKILGLSRDEAVGKSVYELFKDQDWLKSDFLTNDLVHAEAVFQHEKRPSVFDLRISPVKNRGKKLIGHLMMFRDITELKDMQAELIRLATTDPLTGVFNRRRIMEIGETDFSRAERYNRPFSILMLDLDLFKNVNDEHGHQVGDLVLKAFAQAVAGQVRENDSFGRVGGEEFCVLLAETDCQAALLAGERIRSVIAGLIIETPGETIRITVSIGAACRHESDSGLEALFQRADAALYQAKARGRNCVYLGPSPSDEKTPPE